MNIAIGADHGGFDLKNQLRDALVAAGHQVRDFGTNSPESSDYPDYAGPVAHAVAEGAADRGILVCGSGVGMAIAANKVKGIRAAVGMNTEAVALTRQHNNANILTLGARFTDPVTAQALVKTFLETPFEAGRHELRVEKISQMETEQ
ncbi:MAG: ribose 5-phosphate isomerase B [Bryobacteraceae bacterium]